MVVVVVAVGGYLINSWQTCTISHSASKENGSWNCAATVEPTASNNLETLEGSSSGISVCTSTVSSAAIPRLVSVLAVGRGC